MVPRAREYGRPGLYFVPNGLLQRTTICGKWHLQRSDPAPMQSVQNAAAAASGCSLKLVGETRSDAQSDADATQIDSCVASAVCIGLETASLAACNQRTDFKVAVLVYKCLHGLRTRTPNLSDDCQLVTEVGQRASTFAQSTQTQTRLEGRSFAVAGPLLWLEVGTICRLNFDSETPRRAQFIARPFPSDRNVNERTNQPTNEQTDTHD